MAMPRKKGPKSHKADGTPKKRWSAAERATRGVGPRHSGGKRNADERRSPRRFGDDDRRDTRPTGREDDRRDARGPRRDDDSRDSRGGNRRDESRGYRGPRDDDRRDFRGGGRRDDDSHGYRGPRDDDRRDARGPRREDDRRDFRGGGRRDDDSRGYRGPRDDDRRDARGPRREDDRRDFRGGPRRDDDRSDVRGPRGEDRRGPRRDDDTRGQRPWAGRDDRRTGGSERPARQHRPLRDEVRPYPSSSRRPDERRSSRDERPRSSWQDRPARDDRQQQQAPESDQMSWEAAVAGDLEVSAQHEQSGFAELGVALPLVAAMAARGITEPFPIQRATIADAIAGRDVLGRGRTGSGKTLAFGLPMLTKLAEGFGVGAPRAVILTPTRELALQIADNLSPLAAAVGVDLTLVAGGMSYGPQLKAFERGVDVVVATPGRLIDLLEQGAADLSQVQLVVLDEADHMSELGFMEPVRTILDATPADGQRLLFSATLDGAVDQLVRRYLHDPVTHEVDSSQASVTTMTHHLLQLAPHHKNAITAEIANRDGRTLVFARTQMGADRIAGQLREAGVLAGALHGGLTQGARARILAAFKDGKVPVLVATDVAARGIHVDDVSLVLQVDPPMNSKDYLHRAGRTARAGESGAVVSLMLPHQRKQIRRLTGQAGVHAAPVGVEPGSAELREVTGARPCSQTPIPESEYLALIAPKPQQRRRPRHDGAGGGWKRHGQGGRPRGNRGGRY